MKGINVNLTGVLVIFNFPHFIKKHACTRLHDAQSMYCIIRNKNKCIKVTLQHKEMKSKVAGQQLFILLILCVNFLLL